MCDAAATLDAWLWWCFLSGGNSGKSRLQDLKNSAKVAGLADDSVLAQKAVASHANDRLA